MSSTFLYYLIKVLFGPELGTGASPAWSDFISESGGTVVELSGGITYDEIPVTALIQFDVYGIECEAN